MATKWVDSVAGSDSNNGTTKALAYKTFNYAVQQLATNDTLMFVPQSTDYTMTTVYVIPDGVTFDAESTPDVVNGSYVRINGSATSNGMYTLGSFTAKKIWFYNFVPSANSFIYPYRTFTGARVTTFEDCLFSKLYGMVTTASRGGIIGGNGSVTADSAASNTFTFRRCAIWDIGSNDSQSSGCFLRCNMATTTLFENCTFYFPTPAYYPLAAIVGAGAEVSSNVTYTNCIIDNQSGTNVSLNSYVFSQTAPIIDANYPATVNNSVYRNVITTSITFNSCSNSDPKFLDVANNDFRLKTDSPAINIGMLV